MCAVPVTTSSSAYVPVYYMRLIDFDYLIDWLMALG